MPEWLNPGSWKGLKSNTLFVLGTITITHGYYVQLNTIIFPSENQYLSDQKFYVLFTTFTIILLTILGLYFKFLLIYEKNGIEKLRKDEIAADKNGAKKAQDAINKIKGAQS